MSRANDERILKYEEAYAALSRRLGSTGFLWVGTVLHQFTSAANPPADP